MFFFSFCFTFIFFAALYDGCHWKRVMLKTEKMYTRIKCKAKNHLLRHLFCCCYLQRPFGFVLLIHRGISMKCFCSVGGWLCSVVFSTYFHLFYCFSFPTLSMLASEFQEVFINLLFILVPFWSWISFHSYTRSHSIWNTSKVEKHKRTKNQQPQQEQKKNAKSVK